MGLIRSIGLMGLIEYFFWGGKLAGYGNDFRNGLIVDKK